MLPLSKTVPTIIKYIIGVLLLSLSSAAVYGETDDSAILAKVNNSVITRKNLQWATTHISSFETSSSYLLQEKVLDQLINREVLYQESVANDITVSDAEIKRHLSRLIKSLKTSQSSFAQEIGLSGEEVTAEIKKDLGIQKLLEQQLRMVTEVSTHETKAYYDNHPDKFIIEGSVHAYHILMKVAPGSDDNTKAVARERITAISEQLRYGADFFELAKKYSECPSSIKGGDLGFITRGQKYKIFENAVFSLVVGEISGIVETPLGYHLITITEKQPASIIEFEKVEKQLKQFLIEEKNQQLIKDLVQNLKQKSEIKRFTN